jgi:hypothetical protein
LVSPPRSPTRSTRAFPARFRTRIELGRTAVRAGEGVDVVVVEVEDVEFGTRASQRERSVTAERCDSVAAEHQDAEVRDALEAVHDRDAVVVEDPETRGRGRSRGARFERCGCAGS